MKMVAIKITYTTQMAVNPTEPKITTSSGPVNVGHKPVNFGINFIVLTRVIYIGRHILIRC